MLWRTGGGVDAYYLSMRWALFPSTRVIKTFGPSVAIVPGPAVADSSLFISSPRRDDGAA